MPPDPSVLRGSEAHRCVDCGATDDLYLHEPSQEWACEEVGDCIERQRDEARAERDRYRVALERLADTFAPDGLGMRAFARDTLRALDNEAIRDA